MFRTFLLIAVLLSAVMSIIAFSLRTGPFRVGLIDIAVTALEDRVLRSDTIRTLTLKSSAPLVLIELPERERKAARATSVREADRSEIATLLDAIREAPGIPTGVLVDIDISPTAGDFAGDFSPSEAALLDALRRWHESGRARLLLARGEGCRLAPGRPGASGQIETWSGTPYDQFVSAEPSSGNISWTCPLPVVWTDGLVRSFEPFACASMSKDGTGRFVVKGPSALIGRSADTGWFVPDEAACDTGASSSSAAAGLPVALAPEALEQIRFHAPGADSLPSLNDALVVIGQSGLRTGDRWNTPAEGRVPGYVLIGAHLQTLSGSKGQLNLPFAGTALLAMALTALFVFFYYALRITRRELSHRLASSAGRPAAFTVRLALSPPVILWLVSEVVAALLPYPLMWVFDPAAWVQVFCASGGALLALALADFALQEDLQSEKRD
ncbi:MAG TPA: hypothetical protein PKV67_10285 [Hyphomonas sp.]|nr:hypothetical protein [Hyphomonas sp.]